jgi:hypothetical protein
MPSFETEVDVDVDDFYHECDRRDKKELIDLVVSDAECDRDLKEYLKDSLEGEFGSDVLSIVADGRETFDQMLFKKSLSALDKNYHCLPNELVEQVIKLAEKFTI